MRSELVYRALVHVQCRYQLCQVTAQGTRKMHRPNCRIQDTMNDVLALLHKSSTGAGGRSASAGQAAEALSLKNATQKQSLHKLLNRVSVSHLGFSEDRIWGNLR